MIAADSRIAAGSMVGDGGLKMKEASAPEGGDPSAMANLVGLFMMNSMAEARLSGVGRKEAVPSGPGDDRDLEMKEPKPWEVEGGILRLKKEADAAFDLWGNKFVPGAMDRWLERKAKTVQEAQVPGVGKKVVKRKLPTGLVDYMAEDPFVVLMDIPEEELATKTPAFRQMYDIAKILEAKTREYHQALIDQQQIFGYAMDEDEVPVDESEVAKN